MHAVGLVLAPLGCALGAICLSTLIPKDTCQFEKQGTRLQSNEHCIGRVGKRVGNENNTPSWPVLANES